MKFSDLFHRGLLAAALLAGLTPVQAQYDGSGAQPVTRGATGRTTLTPNNLIIGAGTAPVTFIDPTGQTGKCLVSNGTMWAPGVCIGSSSVVGTAPITVSNSGGVATLGLTIDSNFAVVSNALALAPIVSGGVVANCGAASAEPAGCTLSLLFDRAIGATNGQIAARIGGVWAPATFGTGLALTGSAINLQPASAGTIGGVNSIALSANNWVQYITTAGLPVLAQPAFGNLSGSLACTQRPALTGNVTAAAGSCVTAISTAAVSYAMIQNVTAARLWGNPAGVASAGSEISLGSTLTFAASALQTAAGTGDITWPANSFTTTLATVNSTPGTAGSSTAVPIVTTNAKGLVTSVTTSAPVVAAVNITGQVALASGGTGSDLSATGGTSQFLKQNTLGGVVASVRPTCSDLSNASASCSSDATVASNITSGTLPAARLPNPTATSLGGVQSAALVANQFVNSISTTGVPSLAQPSFANLSGSLIVAQLPAFTGDVSTVAGASGNATSISASAVTFAKFQNLAALSVFGNCTAAAAAGGNVTGVANQVLRVNGAGTACGFGAIDLSQAAAVTGTLQAASEPAHTGDVTNPAGSLTLTIGANRVTNAMLAGSIASSKLVGTDIATLGTVTAGTWNATTVGLAYGGTNTNLSATGGTGQYVKQATLGGALSVGTIPAGDLPLATLAAFGAVKPDGTTISISGGVITATGSSATAVTVGTTNVGSGTSGSLLYNSAGVLGNQTITTALGARTTLPTTQQFLTGSGTYNRPANVLYIEVKLIGAGGGGGGTGTSPVAGSAGGNTTFSTLTGGGGSGGSGSYGGGAGGAASGGNDNFPGGMGSTGSNIGSGAAGGHGGNGIYGGGGTGGSSGVNPGTGATNSGSGGGGGFQGSATQSAGGGGSGGGVYAIINSPSATYSYAVGVGGAGGSASAQSGGNGSDGRILVIEHYGS